MQVKTMDRIQFFLVGVLSMAVIAVVLYLGVSSKGNYDDKAWDWCRKQGGEVVHSRSQGYVCVEAIRRTTT